MKNEKITSAFIIATMIFIEAFKSVSDAKMVFIPNNIVIREDARAEIAESRKKAKELTTTYKYHDDGEKTKNEVRFSLFHIFSSCAVETKNIMPGVPAPI